MAGKLGNLKKYRAILFDLDDTLRANYPHPQLEFNNFLSSQGLEIGKEARLSAHRWAHAYWATSNTLLEDIQKHNGYEAPFWKNYTRRHLEALGISEIDIKGIAPLINRHMRKTYRPESKLVPKCMETLEYLKARGLLIGLLTNRSNPIYREMSELGLDHHMDIFLTAGQVSAFKPQPELFTVALELIKVTPDESIYVGDNYYADIIGAQNANMQPVLVDPLGLYPQAECPSILSISELMELFDVRERSQ